MNLREIANAYNMSVSELAKYLGYSRQALYRMADADPGKQQELRKEISMRLRALSNEIFLKESQAATDALTKRNAIADAVEQGEWRISYTKEGKNSPFLIIHERQGKNL